MDKDDVLKIIKESTSTKESAYNFIERAFELYLKEEKPNHVVIGWNDIVNVSIFLQNGGNIEKYIFSVNEDILSSDYTLLDATLCNICDAYVSSSLGTEEYNIIKSACAYFKISQKDLANILEVSKASVERWSSTGEVTANVANHISLLFQNSELKKELFEIKSALRTLKKYS